MCSIEIANQANHRKEYAITTHRNVWYFYRYHPMSSNGTHGLVLPSYFELLPWGTFLVFTQRASCHSITRRFTDLRISRHHRVSPVYFELLALDLCVSAMYFERSIMSISPSSSFTHLSCILIFWYLDLSYGFIGKLHPHSLVHQH